jgi:hypothetical protein
MAHHQGMSLLAMTNFLCDDIVQQWFHRDPRVGATELLLQERSVLRQPRPGWQMRLPRLPRRAPAPAGKELVLASQ